MWCKTEQERIGSPARFAAQAAGLSGYWSQLARAASRRKVWGKTNDRPRRWRKPSAGQNPAYSHPQAGAFQK